MTENEIDSDLTQIISKIKQGDKQTYSLIIERFQRPIFLYCYYTLYNLQEAEDVTQETFIKAYKYIGKFECTQSFSPWLYKIAQNSCIDVLKKKKKDLNTLFAYQKEQIEQAQNPTIHLVHTYLDKLTKEEKQIVLLRSLEEYSYEEIAFIMNIKPATVRKKYERIRKKLIQEKKRGVNTYGHSF
ncbi:RNA polymerase sigma factor [Paenibacillus wulumuqiensis]|uniref:RNA polymerase sigma factor n=1 Tax=Paenibacillus wulumuqiensis TaxID=1567107 RepID=UPI000696D442|nr:RNA polymerase sigma factor [Paenibacillus wulumuqiensis]